MSSSSADTLTPVSRQERFLALVRGQAHGPLATISRAGLWLASWPYGLVVLLRNLGFRLGWLRTSRVGVPVVSIGNLTVGGTGKTPCVEWVARYYRDRGRQVAILSRGYGSDSGPNDEALVLEEVLPDVPHLQDPDRVKMSRTAVEELESDLLVLDDGFQHRRLARDLDLVLVDATDPWGLGYLLPRGLLREPLGGLRRADAVVVTRADQVSGDALQAIQRRIAHLAPGKALAHACHRPTGFINAAGITENKDLVKGRSVAGFCGIGNPESFRRSLTDLGARLVDFRTYPDHHRYSRDDVSALSARARSLPEDTLFVTTHKDLVKLRVEELGGKPLWALRIELSLLTNRAELESVLARVLAPDPQAGSTPQENQS